MVFSHSGIRTDNHVRFWQIASVCTAQVGGKTAWEGEMVFILQSRALLPRDAISASLSGTSGRSVIRHDSKKLAASLCSRHRGNRCAWKSTVPSVSHCARITRPARGAEGREGHGSGAQGEGLGPHTGPRACPETKVHTCRQERRPQKAAEAPFAVVG